MPQRPFVTGLIAVGIAVSAMRVAGPSMSSANLATTGSITSGRVASTERQGTKDGGSWSGRFDEDPAEAGRTAAKHSLYATICGVLAFPDKPCPAEGAEAFPARPMYTGQDTVAPEVAFAILPDPVHTHLALWFDRATDALQDAFIDSGWQFQRQWMPWSTENGSGSKLKDAQQERLFREGQEEFPGVLVFIPGQNPPTTPEIRAAKKANREHQTSQPELPAMPPKIVFVIGESPTSGINQTQFREAVRQLKALAPAQTTLKIVGPSFTGAGPSLHALIGEAKSESLKTVAVDIASGSISDADCTHLLPHGYEDKAHSQCADGKPGGSATDTFVSFDADLAWEMRQTEAYLHEKGGIAYNQMAQLSEDESGFGALGAHLDTGDSILKLTFPRNISHLRSAYQKNGIWGFGGSTSSSGSISLSLDFEDTHEADDSVPSYAGKQMPVSQEGSMGQVSSILEQRHIKAVLLSATDVLDELFVAQILARQAPNLVVVVRGTDVLFLRSGDNGVYHNMYAVSPWPLIPKNYFWSQPGKERSPLRTFANDHAQGYYTAARYLLQGKDSFKGVQDYTSPLLPTKRPPLWLLAIGHGAYWPFALLPDSIDSAKENDPNRPPDVTRSSMSLPELPHVQPPAGLRTPQDRIPISQQLLLLVGCLFSLFHAGKCFDLDILKGFALRYRIHEQSIFLPKLAIQIAISLVGLGMLCLIGGKIDLIDPWRDLFWLFAFLAGASSLSLAAARNTWQIVEHRRARRNAHDAKQQEFRIPLAVYCLLFLGLGAAIWMLVWWLLTPSPAPDQGLAEFFIYRSKFPLSGASPVFPLLLTLIGLTVFLLSQLDRFSFTESLRPRLPGKTGGVPNCPTNDSVEPLNDYLVYPPPAGIVPRKLRTLAWIACLMIVVGGIVKLRPEIFDGVHLSLFTSAAMFGLLLSMMWDLISASLLWRKLKALCLDPLEASPLRHGFSALCGITWKDIWFMPRSHSGFTEYRSLLRALEQSSRDVLRDEVAFKPGGKLGDRVNTMRSTRGKGTTLAVIEIFGTVQEALAEAAEEMLAKLKDSWNRQAERITAADAPLEKDARPETPEAKSKPPSVDLHTLRAAWRADILSVAPNTQFVDLVPAPPPEKEDEFSPRVVQTIREEWVALIYIHYIRTVLIQIRGRLITASMLYLLLVWAITSYPYLNRHILIVGLSVLLGLLAAIVISIYASINRDAILSRTTENKPGHLDLDFYLKIASMVGIPLLGFVASQLPEVSSFLFSWIEPGMTAVK